MFDKFGIDKTVPVEGATYKMYLLHVGSTLQAQSKRFFTLKWLQKSSPAVKRTCSDQSVCTCNLVPSLTIVLFIKNIVKPNLHVCPALDNNGIYKWHLVKHQACPLMIIDTASSFWYLQILLTIISFWCMGNRMGSVVVVAVDRKWKIEVIIFV